jgi:hypothetical protein
LVCFISLAILVFIAPDKEYTIKPVEKEVSISSLSENELKTF